MFNAVALQYSICSSSGCSRRLKHQRDTQSACHADRCAAQRILGHASRSNMPNLRSCRRSPKASMPRTVEQERCPTRCSAVQCQCCKPFCCFPVSNAYSTVLYSTLLYSKCTTVTVQQRPRRACFLWYCMRPQEAAQEIFQAQFEADKQQQDNRNPKHQQLC